MSAVSLFFTGVLISEFQSFQPSIKVPLTFLIISTFSFIFAATIYTNASTELTLNRLRSVQRYMVYAKNIDELLGLYPFILATPMVIGAVTEDSFVRVVSITVALLGFGLYSQSRFSILDDEVTRLRKRVISFVTVSLALGLYYFQGVDVDNAVFMYSSLAIILLGILMTLVVIFCTAGKQYNMTIFRRFETDDADEVSTLMHKNLKRIKPRALPREYIQQLRTAATPQAITALANDKSITVAEFKGRIAGFGSLYGHDITNIFTDPTLHRKGIGRQLVEYLEAEAKDDGFKYTTYTANPVDVDFFKRIGYEVESEQNNASTGTSYTMKKKLS